MGLPSNFGFAWGLSYVEGLAVLSWVNAAVNNKLKQCSTAWTQAISCDYKRSFQLLKSVSYIPFAIDNVECKSTFHDWLYWFRIIGCNQLYLWQMFGRGFKERGVYYWFCVFSPVIFLTLELLCAVSLNFHSSAPETSLRPLNTQQPQRRKQITFDLPASIPPPKSYERLNLWIALYICYG